MRGSLSVIGGDYQEFIFDKNYTMPNQINGYLDNLDPQRLKQGVSVEEIANNIVKYGREDWPQEDFHRSLSAIILTEINTLPALSLRVIRLRQSSLPKTPSLLCSY